MSSVSYEDSIYSSRYYWIKYPSYSEEIISYYGTNVRITSKIVANKFIEKYNVPRCIVILYLKYMIFSEKETIKDLNKAIFINKTKQRVLRYGPVSNWFLYPIQTFFRKVKIWEITDDG